MRLIMPGKRIRVTNAGSSLDGELGLMVWTDGELGFVVLDKFGNRTFRYQYLVEVD
jgi:hypothetical protein